jgi:putative flippase GtrA
MKFSLLHKLSLNKIKFLFTGIVNTIFGYLAFALLIYFDYDYLIALLISTILGVLFNYFSYGVYVFSSKTSPLKFFKFIVSYILIYCFNTLMLHVLKIVLMLDIYFLQMICIPFNVVISWVLMNRWVFKND